MRNANKQTNTDNHYNILDVSLLTTITASASAASQLHSDISKNTRANAELFCHVLHSCVGTVFSHGSYIGSMHNVSHPSQMEMNPPKTAYSFTHIYIYIYICVCVCVCVRARARVCVCGGGGGGEGQEDCTSQEILYYFKGKCGCHATHEEQRQCTYAQRTKTVYMRTIFHTRSPLILWNTFFSVC